MRCCDPLGELLLPAHGCSPHARPGLAGAGGPASNVAALHSGPGGLRLASPGDKSALGLVSSSPGSCQSCSAPCAELALWCAERVKVPMGSVVPWGGHTEAGQLGKSPASPTAWVLQPGHNQGSTAACLAQQGTEPGTCLLLLFGLPHTPWDLHGLHHPSVEREWRFLLCFL